LIELAGEINTEMPHFVVDKLVEALSSQMKPLKEAVILILGVAYKKDVEDCRESPSLAIWESLKKKGAMVFYHDPFISQLPHLHEHTSLSHEKSVALESEMLAMVDVVLILTDHSCIDYSKVAEHARLIVDTRNACKNVDPKYRDKIIKA